MSADNYNLFARFEPQFEQFADKELLRTEDDSSFTYAAVDRESARLAAYLTGSGVSPGDRVSVQAHKSPQSLCLYLACLRAGFVYHPLNMAYTSSELEYFLDNADPAVIVCDPANVEPIHGIAGSDSRLILTLDRRGNGTLVSESRGIAGEFATLQCAAGDIAALLYSSGTTGVPKGIMLSHDNLYQNMKSLVDAWGFSDQDRLLHALPIFHVHGLFVALGCVLLSGASMRWLPAFDARKVVEFLPECSVLMGVPTFYTRLLAREEFDANICRDVRLFVSGSAPLLAETFAEFEERVGHRILERYGMTETNMNTSNPLHGERKPGTVGPPLPGVEVRITDDTGAVVGTGEIGDLQVRGANVFKGYWKLPDKTAEDFSKDGYFITGDKASIDEDGYVTIVGRAKDLVISGGLNVYPKEVELFIDDLPGVKESAVIGVPHADFGEAVVAIVVCDEQLDESSITKPCRENLANFKVPKRVIFVPELPRNTMAKVQKNVLRENYADLFA